MAASVATMKRGCIFQNVFRDVVAKSALDRPSKNLRFFSTATEKKVEEYDVVIVGGGIVGVSTARELALRHPKLKMALMEKEPQLATHQSGHNSGVIHAGIYYKPGTIKAKLCVEGLNLAYSYLDSNKIPYKKCGKLIVATCPSEVGRLNDLYERGLQNNAKDLKVIEKDEIQKIEPHCRGLKAIHSPHTGIVDWGLVTNFFGQDFERSGGKIYLNYKVVCFRESSCPDYPVTVASETTEVRAKYVLTCGGLYSDKLCQMSGCDSVPQIVPFRGEYLILKPHKVNLVNGNIYPVPDPRFPFLGVHFTPRMDGNVWLGPNAVLALRREGYKWSDLNVGELKEIVMFPGFRKLAKKHIAFGSQELLKSAFMAAQVKDLQKYVPELKLEDVGRGPAGVRAQALDMDGNFVDDFVFDVGKTGIGKRVLHCRNAPSPGATSSMAIAKWISDKMKDQFQLH